MGPSLSDAAHQAWDAGQNKRAFKLFLAAAQDGEVDAFNSVGYFYDHGIGVKRDADSAYAWYRRAALRGNLTGILNLGIWYRDSGNLRRSKLWFEKAHAKGDGSAAFELGKIWMRRRSSLHAKRARHYLTTAARSKFISEDERTEARVLLGNLKARARSKPSTPEGSC
jgi:TPR repeat protein